MSTRANIIIKETWKYTDRKGVNQTGESKLYFYRHSDGYPSGTMPTLRKFINLVKAGTIRDNVSQAAGWLILLGAAEYKSVSPRAFTISEKDKKAMPKYRLMQPDYKTNYFKPKDWKVGAYEPTDGIHGDIEYLYIIDLTKKKISIIEEDFGKY